MITIVLFWNLQAAILFMSNPSLFVASFELEGVPGKAAVVGYGILFLMWQIPYFFALLHPRKFKLSLWQALIMQSIGFIGETILYSTIPSEYIWLRSSIFRFILFDGSGVLLLVMAALLLNGQKTNFNRSE